MTSTASHRHLGSVTLCISALMLATLPAVAEQSSPRVRVACSPDAKRLCGKHDLDSPDMKRCMEDKGDQLSRPCVQALEDDGIIPRGYYKGL